MGKTIAIIGVPWNAGELAFAVRDARELGARLAVVDTWPAMQRIEKSLECLRIPVPALEESVVTGAVARLYPQAVVSITELTMELAARVRERLGHEGTPSSVEHTVLHKSQTRAVLKKAGLTKVEFWDLPVTDLHSFVATAELPLIVKPCSFTGSTAVRLLFGQDDVKAVLQQFDVRAAELYGRNKVIVETFIPGPEISAEGLVVDGELTLFALTDKINTGEPTFYEIAHVMPSRFTRHWHQRVHEYLQRVVSALGIVTSPFHAELKLVDDTIEIVEIHSRFGGGKIMDLLRKVYLLQPHHAYFAAVLNGVRSSPGVPDQVGGTGFFVGRVGRPFAWPSFDFPHPGAVTEIDFGARRRPEVVEYEGLRLQYWRAGHVLFSSEKYQEVMDNALFMRAQILRGPGDPATGRGSPPH